MPPPPRPVIGPERIALWELSPFVPPLWDVVSAGAGGFPWFGLDPKTAVLAVDNGWLFNFVKDQERESTIQAGLFNVDRITPCSNRSLFQEELSRADNPNRTHRCAHREIRLDR